MKKLLILADDEISTATNFSPSIVQLEVFKDDGLKYAVEELEKFVEGERPTSEG